MRNNYLCIWSSSYDRGLENLLDIWPEVIKAVPKAELNITYGWNLYDAAYPDNPERHAWKAKVDQKMNQPGIHHLGRIGQRDMVALLKQTGLWTYPTDFDEISCITAMKCQIYGVIPVVMDKAALKETVEHGTKLKGDINDPKVKKEYTKILIGWLKDHNRQKAVRKAMTQDSATKYSWDGIAKEWLDEFKKPSVLTKQETKAFKDFVFKEVDKNEKRR